ncbi:MAG: alpha/beta hydrolase [Opitutaceae bacterium]|nr:alpha/beta hydrolase [Opitutaceae bacterium]
MLILLVCAVVVLGLSLLTVLPAPARVPWRLAVLAGEYGHWLACLPVALTLVAWWIGGVLPVPIMVLCLVALGCCLQPLMQARRLAKALPEALSTAFGPGRPPNPPFEIRRLFARHRVRPRIASFAYAPGLYLDFYAPQKASRDAACVVVIHGGGWDGGDRGEVAHFNAWLADSGHAVAAIDYRLAPAHPWPAQRDDARLALAWLKAQAPRLGFAADRLILFGRSAGGQIASAVGCADKDPAIRGVISFYAPHDMPFAWSVSRPDDALNSLQLMRQYLGGPPNESRRALYQSASGQLNVDATTPPMLLMHGAIDTLVWRRHGERMAARLAEASRPHVLIELPWATHAFEYNLNGPGGQLARFAVGWFIEAVTR